MKFIATVSHFMIIFIFIGNAMQPPKKASHPIFREDKSLPPVFIAKRNFITPETDRYKQQLNGQMLGLNSYRFLNKYTTIGLVKQHIGLTNPKCLMTYLRGPPLPNHVLLKDIGIYDSENRSSDTLEYLLPSLGKSMGTDMDFRHAQIPNVFIKIFSSGAGDSDTPETMQLKDLIWVEAGGKIEDYTIGNLKQMIRKRYRFDAKQMILIRHVRLTPMTGFDRRGTSLANNVLLRKFAVPEERRVEFNGLEYEWPSSEVRVDAVYYNNDMTDAIVAIDQNFFFWQAILGSDDFLGDLKKRVKQEFNQFIDEHTVQIITLAQSFDEGQNNLSCYCRCDAKLMDKRCVYDGSFRISDSAVNYDTRDTPQIKRATTLERLFQKYDSVEILDIDIWPQIRPKKNFITAKVVLDDDVTVRFEEEHHANQRRIYTNCTVM